MSIIGLNACVAGNDNKESFATAEAQKIRTKAPLSKSTTVIKV